MKFSTPTIKHLLNSTDSTEISNLTDAVNDNLAHIYQAINDLKRLCNHKPVDGEFHVTEEFIDTVSKLVNLK